MKNYTNKNGLPMKGIDMKPFHGGQNEYFYSHIGMRLEVVLLVVGIHHTAGTVS